MLGWEITVIRPQTPLLGPDDPRLDSREQGSGVHWHIPPALHGDTLAAWSSPYLGGLDWLWPENADPLLSRELRGGGYPSIWAVRAKDLADSVDREFVWRSFTNRSPADLSAIDAVPQGEWVLLEAWDQS